ncbi:MAG: nicotinate-nicotinamide nucleotide adenylyltransferase [bacterium]|nr:nicotinate-nicotinamide nucleotide adenylyltransferase [bacterium]
MKIALFGGSFDPPHRAHVQVVQYLLDSGQFDQIWIVPSKTNPFKDSSSNFSLRCKMCSLAFEAFGDGVQVLDVDQKLSGYTIDLVKYLMAQHPECDFTFVGGSDLKEQLPRWKDGKLLEAMISFKFLPRPPDPKSPFLPFSSTEVREALARGEDPEKFLPQKVAEFVKRENLYRSP